MRIGFIVYGSLDTLTGGYLYDRIVARGMMGLGHEVDVISLPAGSYFRRLCLAFSTELYRRLLVGNYDILIQDELCHPSLFLVNRKLRHKAVRPILVALVHHLFCKESRPFWQTPFLSLVERTFLRSVDGFIHNSKTTRQAVASLAGTERPQIIAYPAGNRFGEPLSIEVISNRTQRAGPLELLFLGIVIPRKGLLPLLSALATVDRRLWRLSVVGGLDVDPAYAARAKKLCRQLNLSASVRFMGPRQDEDLTDILRTSHLFCMPYAYEGFGIAILEAMAFGLPAIGCRHGAACETIIHGMNGFLLDPDDSAGLERLIRQLHSDRRRLQQMSVAARATFFSRPVWQESVAAIDTFLGQLRRLPAQRKVAGPVQQQENQG